MTRDQMNFYVKVSVLLGDPKPLNAMQISHLDFVATTPRLSFGVSIFFGVQTQEIYSTKRTLGNIGQKASEQEKGV